MHISRVGFLPTASPIVNAVQLGAHRMAHILIFRNLAKDLIAIDRTIDDDVSDVNTAWPEFACGRCRKSSDAIWCLWRGIAAGLASADNATRV